jgi:hypothetical protein
VATRPWPWLPSSSSAHFPRKSNFHSVLFSQLNVLLWSRSRSFGHPFQGSQSIPSNKTRRSNTLHSNSGPLPQTDPRPNLKISADRTTLSEHPQVSMPIRRPSESQAVPWRYKHRIQVWDRRFVLIESR